MKAVVQRVSRATVTVEGRVAGRCRTGLLVLVAAHREDTDDQALKLAQKVVNLRIFNDPDGKMNLALGDLDPSLEPGILAISNFTVYGDTSKNRRPSFVEAAPYDLGERLFERFVQALQSQGVAVQTGVFGAHMDVELINDGPVTVILEATPPGSK